MTGPRPLPRRSLQARLALFYAAGVFVAGIVVLAIVTLPLVGIQSTTPVHSTAPGTLTGTGRGIGPHQLLVGSAVAIGVLIPIALAAGWFIAGRFLRPLRAMAATASAISAGDLQQRLDLGEPTDELTELGHILDDLLARLQSSFDAQRHFVANASHELCTPLAGLHTLLEVTLADPDADADALRSTCQEALALCGHQERLVQALLALATSERGLARKDTLDLAHVAREVLASRRDEAAQGGIDLAEHLTPAVTAGDPRLIESLVANLVDNAIRHNHPDGHVLITTQTSGTQAALTITNSGPVIPDDQIQRLFQPFQKLAPGRHHNGFGLGLAIVTAIAQAHHATLTTSARPEGGLTITVRFPHPPPAGPSLPTERLPSMRGGLT
ncbi:HAMP domain-containing sensor histidine kinase [Streptomyces sp. NPDC002082]|uniref:sensor histidine kinase n=1 Tax=Streptomyces sp. NPDC002082 TaxID=3154772 RepID=UPI0033166EBD